MIRYAVKIFRFLFTAWATLVFTGIMLAFLPFILLPPLFGHRAAAVTFLFLKIWSWLLSKLIFVHYEIRGNHHLKRFHPCIYVSNHTSFLDLPGLSIAIPGQFRPLAKKELLKIPVFGWVVACATIVVDRSSAESRSQSLINLKKILKMDIPALIFPEGTQNRSEQLLQPFKDGAFRMALETMVPVIPVAISGAGTLMPPGKFSIRPGKIYIEFGEPILPENFKDMQVADLNTLTFERIRSMLISLPKK